MKIHQDKVIVAVDTGYGNIKNANHCFRTGITAYDSEPLSPRICWSTPASIQRRVAGAVCYGSCYFIHRKNEEQKAANAAQVLSALEMFG